MAHESSFVQSRLPVEEDIVSRHEMPVHNFIFMIVPEVSGMGYPLLLTQNIKSDELPVFFNSIGPWVFFTIDDV